MAYLARFLSNVGTQSLQLPVPTPVLAFCHFSFATSVSIFFSIRLSGTSHQTATPI